MICRYLQYVLLLLHSPYPSCVYLSTGTRSLPHQQMVPHSDWKKVPVELLPVTRRSDSGCVIDVLCLVENFPRSKIF